jgi:hypothetical protein
VRTCVGELQRLALERAAQSSEGPFCEAIVVKPHALIRLFPTSHAVFYIGPIRAATRAKEAIFI